MTRPTVIVSACLVGLKTRYDGRDALSDEVMASLAGATVIPVCPEQLGGLPTPRTPAWIDGGATLDNPGGAVLDGHICVIDEAGADLTEKFVHGAYMVLDIARMTGATEAVLKDRSPSCGVTCTHTSENLTSDGPGVTAAVLQRAGIKVRGA